MGVNIQEIIRGHNSRVKNIRARPGPMDVLWYEDSPFAQELEGASSEEKSRMRELWLAIAEGRVVTREMGLPKWRGQDMLFESWHILHYHVSSRRVVYVFRMFRGGICVPIHIGEHPDKGSNWFWRELVERAVEAQVAWGVKEIPIMEGVESVSPQLNDEGVGDLLGHGMVVSVKTRYGYVFPCGIRNTRRSYFDVTRSFSPYRHIGERERARRGGS